MKKIIKKSAAILLAVIMMLTLGMPALAADTTSNEYQFFSLLNKSATGLTDAFNTGTSTGNWTAAKEQLLNYYKTKFQPLSWIDYNESNLNTAIPSMNDTVISNDETYLSKQTVTTTLQQISIPLTAGQVRENYILAVLKHNTASGVCMYSKEYGSSYAPVLTVSYSDGTSQDFSVSADTYIRATGSGQSNSYASTNYGSSSNLWAMHRSDTSNSMPYSNDEMRTYIKFNYSASGKSISSAAIKVYAQVKNPNSGTPASGTTLELMAFTPCYNSWTESTLTWNVIANANSFAFYSWDGLGGIIWNESLYGVRYANLHVSISFVYATSRLCEESTLCRTGHYTEAKNMLLRFADQTYDVIKNATTTSGGFPTKEGEIECANRSLLFPYVYRSLLMNNALTADENYRILRWYYQDIQYLYKEKSGQIFVNGTATPNTTTNTYKDNYGPWYISGFYNTFAFFGEFSEASSWQQMFEARLNVLAGVFVNPDGSYVEVTFGYPSAVIRWYANMMKYMAKLGYSSSASNTLKQNMVNVVKYLADCVYPNGYMPLYGDGGRVYLKSIIGLLFEISGIANSSDKKIQNLLYIYTDGAQGIKPGTTAYYPNAKIVTDRTGWTANDSMLFMNAKGGGIHSHADSLSVMMYANGKEILVDKGHTTYDSSNEGYDLNSRTYTHNTIEVDGTAQRHPGGSGATIAAGYDGTAQNIRQYSNSASATIRAYTTSNENATHYRNVTWVKEYGGLLLVNDWVKSANSSSRSCTQNWHTLPNASPATTASLGGFTNCIWGYTNFSSGANMMISQATPNNDGDNTITASRKTGPDSNSSSGQSQYLEFAQSGKNVTFNTAIANYTGTSLGIRASRMDTGVKDNVASAMQVQRFNNSSLSTLVDEIAYYNSFEDTPSERTIMRRIDVNNQYFMFKTNAGNAWYHVRLNETVDMLSLSNGSKLDTYMASTVTSTEESPMARINTSAKVTDISAKYDTNTGVVAIETSDKNVSRGSVAVTVEFRQFGNITGVTLNGEALDSTDCTINGKTAVIAVRSVQWEHEYYYPAGYQFVKNIAVTYNGSGSSASTEIKEAVGGFVDEDSHMYTDSYHTHYDFTHNCSIITQDLAAGTGNGKYIYMGYSMTTNPADVNACTGVGVETNAYSGSDFIDTVTETVRGVCTTWYLCNNGGSDTYNPKMHSDGAVDLNVNAGGATIKTYAVYDRNFGPAIDAIAVIEYDKGERITANNGNDPYCGAGWYTGVALNAPENLPDLNAGAGGRTLYMYYHTPCVEVQSDTLRANLAELKAKYEKINSYTLTSPTTTATIQSAINAAQAIVTDLGDGYTTYKQAQIDAAAAECAAQSSRMTQVVTVTYNLNGSTGTKPDNKTFVFNSGSIVTAAEPTKPYYVISYNVDGGNTVSAQTVYYNFGGWKSSATGKILNALTSVSSADLVGTTYTSTVTLTAQWTPGSVALPSTTKTGYTFGGWLCSADNAVKSAGSSYTPSANVTMTAQWTANTFSVRFNGSGATGGTMANQSFTYGTAQALTQNAFERKYTVTYDVDGGSAVQNATASYSFTGWATSASGAKEYNDKQSVSNLTSQNNGVFDLYAVWNPASVTLPATTRTGFGFAGWKCSADNQVRGAGASYTPAANVTMTAQWASHTFSVKFNGNGATGGTMVNQPFAYGTAQNLSANEFTRIYTVSFDSAGGEGAADINVDYTFAGWSTSSIGTKIYNDKQLVSNLTDVDGGVYNLYAVWLPGSITLPEISRTGYSFYGWKDSPESDIRFAGTEFTPTSDITLTAQWIVNTYTVVFNGNGSNGGTMSNQSFIYDEAQELAPNVFTRSYEVFFNSNGGTLINHKAAISVFDGWALTASGEAVYADKQSVSNITNIDKAYVDLYAKWIPGTVTLPVTVKTGYKFNGWYDGQTKIGDEGDTYAPSRDITLNAEWSLNSYTVSFLNHDGTVLQTGDWNHGDTPVYSGTTPVKAADSQYIYTFSGWSPEIVPATEDAEYTAQYTTSSNIFTITWVNEDGTVLEVDDDAVGGTIPEYNGETPQKDGTAQYSYVFSGWTPEVSAVTGDTTYTACFAAQINKYTVTWQNYDGTVLQSDTDVPYGSTVQYRSAAPQKDAGSQHTYVFSGWTPEISEITGDTVYTAQFTAKEKFYNVTWKNYDGTVLKIDYNVPFGTVPEYEGNVPLRESDQENTYTFAGWSPELSAVESNTVYTAQYTAQKQRYTITFIDENGCILDSEEFEYGETPQYSGETPAKIYNSEKHFTFSGWTPELSPVDGEKVYMAQFDAQDHNLVYTSDGAAHHGECECGYITDLQAHVPGSDGTCSLCGADVSAFYIDFGDINITSDGATGYDSEGNYVSVGILDRYTVTQLNTSKAANHCINVKSGTHTVVLDNINIERTAMTAYAVSVQGTADATFIIKGENHIKAGTYRAGLDIALDASATIEGDGTLYAVSPLQAGIGGGNGKPNGTLVINSGDIYATGGINGYSAGIGGGTSGTGGNITINGGYVVATGGTYGSGIGGGNGFGGGNITINGGTVTATGGKYAAGIGGGYTGEGGNIVINGGTVKATAGENAPAIGSGYKCTTTFAGIYNSDGDEVTLRIIDTGDAERVYFGGIDTAALRHHPDDDNYYFYACATSAVTAYSGDDVMFFIGEDLEQTDVYSASCVRKGDFLLTDDLDNIEASSAFTFYDGSMYYCSKRIDACEAGILGDVNLDGNADGEDSVLVNCIIVGLLTQADLEPIQYAAADYDFDGEITAADVTALEKAGLLGTVSTLNAEGSDQQ